MGILAVEELLGVRSCGIDAQWKRTYRRAWRVRTDTPFVGALAVREAVPVSIGNSYVFKNASGVVIESDAFAFATSISVEVDAGAEDDCSWIVTSDYGPYDATQFPENPLDHPIKISWGSNRFERAVDQTPPDDAGKTEAILNSAGDYFDPPITCDDSRPTLRIVRNERKYDPQYAMTWKDKVNKYSFNGFNAGTVKMVTPLGELEYNPVCGFYYVVTYEFEVNPEGWERQILDQGLRVLDGDKQKPATDENGQPVTSPVLLDGNGGQLSSTDDPVYMSYKIYSEADYSPLNLDFSGAPGQ